MKKSEFYNQLKKVKTHKEFKKLVCRYQLESDFGDNLNIDNIKDKRIKVAVMRVIQWAYK